VTIPAGSIAFDAALAFLFARIATSDVATFAVIGRINEVVAETESYFEPRRLAVPIKI